MEPFDGLFLWLATCLSEFALLSRSRTDVARELVDPASPIATPTLLGKGSFAYITFREIDPGASTFEFGAYGHGPEAEQLAEQLAEQIRAWDRDHRHGQAARICVYPIDTPADQLPPGRLIEKRHTKVTISWP